MNFFRWVFTDVTEEAAKRAQILADQAFADGNKTGKIIITSSYNSQLLKINK